MNTQYIIQRERQSVEEFIAKARSAEATDQHGRAKEYRYAAMVAKTKADELESAA